MTDQEFIQLALAEDLRNEGDHSTLACIPSEIRGKAVLKIKATGILAGLRMAETIFKFLEPDAQFIAHKQDGDRIESGETAFEISASVHTLLKAERLALNIMQRMSGIATLTRKYVDKLGDSPAKILDTRKTTPLFRAYEKEAVLIGGGHNHRMGLYDMIMLKDNHIDFCGGIQAALRKAKAYVENRKPGMQIEVETRNLEDVKQVLEVGGADRIMLDNFAPGRIREAVQLIGGRAETEASGGIHYDNICDYAATGVDFISVGALTHQAVSLDLSLKAL